MTLRFLVWGSEAINQGGELREEYSGCGKDLFTFGHGLWDTEVEKTSSQSAAGTLFSADISLLETQTEE
jgi:hypothetical protein